MLKIIEQLVVLFGSLMTCGSHCLNGLKRLRTTFRSLSSALELERSKTLMNCGWVGRELEWFPLIYTLETFIVWTWWIFFSVNLNMLHIIVSWYSSASRPSFYTFLGRIHNKAGLSVRLPVRMYICPQKVFLICYTNVCHMTRSKVKVMEVRMLRRLLIS